LGRTIGVPTANIPLTRRPMALRGVFACATRLADGEWVAGAANIGWRPTVGADRPMLEVHLLDRELDLYGETLTVVPCARLRGEAKFDEFDALVAQIHRDLDNARHYFAQAARQAGSSVSEPGPAEVEAAASGLCAASLPQARFPLASAPLPPEPSNPGASAHAAPTGSEDD